MNHGLASTAATLGGTVLIVAGSVSEGLMSALVIGGGTVLIVVGVVILWKGLR